MTISVECDAGGRHELRFGYRGSPIDHFKTPGFYCTKEGLPDHDMDGRFWLRLPDAEAKLNAAMQLTAVEADDGNRYRLDRYADYWRGETDEQ